MAALQEYCKAEIHSVAGEETVCMGGEGATENGVDLFRDLHIKVKSWSGTHSAEFANFLVLTRAGRRKIDIRAKHSDIAPCPNRAP